MSRTRIFGGALLLIGAVAAALEALTFKVNFPTDPLGPAAFPLLGAALLALGGFSLALDSRDVPWPDIAGLRRIALAALSFTAYALFLAPVGFVPATTLAFAALATLFGGRPLRSLAVGFAFALVLFALFVYGLGLPLPLGALFS